MSYDAKLTRMGTCYASGQGVIKDYVQAYAWHTVAVANGNERAKQSLPGIELLITPAQKAEANKVAREIQAKINAQ